MSFPLRAILLSLAPLPALVVGVLVMRRHGVSVNMWGQQLVAGLVLTIACVVISARRWRPNGRRSPAWTIIPAAAALVILALTLLHSHVDGVRRWVSLGPVQLHAGFVALPVLIILAGVVARMESSRAPWIPGLAIMIGAAVLAVQPDSSQAIAFAAAVAVVLLQRRLPSRIDRIAAAVCVGASAFALSRPDPLAAVPHVEGIVSLAATSGAAWLGAAIVALMLLPLPFVIESVKHRGHSEGLGLAAYFVTVCIASFVAPFPVPILGYGLSPILGYFVALGWIVRTDVAAEAKNDRRSMRKTA